MSNVKTVLHCPKCGIIGSVVDARKNIVSLKCPKCQYRWRTISMDCQKCGKPNHYVVDGICMKCYSEQRKRAN